MTKRDASRIPTVPLLIALIILALISAVVSLAFGSEPIPIDQVIDVVKAHLLGQPINSPVATIVWELRMPRALLALIAGAGLALAGAGMQTLIRNPLADPYLLGLSSGASVGATAVITLGIFASFGIWSLSVGALLGALGAAVAVYLIAQAQGGLTPLRLVLAGVVMSSAFSAIASFMVFLSDDNRAANSVMFWMLGSIAGASWAKLFIPTIVLLLFFLSTMLMSSWLDALAMGPATASALGINVRLMRNFLFASTSILVGVLVAVSGGIGFVGLIIPHATRMVVGALHRKVLPIAAAGGALFLLWVDVLSRVVVRPQEIPLGVVTGVIGAPLFLFLMGRRQYSFGGRDS